MENWKLKTQTKEQTQYRISKGTNSIETDICVTRYRKKIKEQKRILFLFLKWHKYKIFPKGRWTCIIYIYIYTYRNIYSTWIWIVALTSRTKTQKLYNYM